MLVIVHLFGSHVAGLFMSRQRLEAENLFLRHRLNIALRRAPQRLRLRGSDRALLVWMTRLWLSLLGLARVVQAQRPSIYDLVESLRKMTVPNARGRWG